MIPRRPQPASGLLLAGLVLSLSACLEVPSRLYACAPDGGCPAGFGCGRDNLCISEDALRDAGADASFVSACSEKQAQMTFRPGCSLRGFGCGEALAGTWCASGACAPLVPFPELDQLCRDNGISVTWSGHAGTVRGGRSYLSDGGLPLYEHRNEQVEFSVDAELSGPCVEGGDCLDTGAAMQLAQSGLTASCLESGTGCRCVLRWSQQSRTSSEVELGAGQLSQLSGGETWAACVRTSELELGVSGKSPAIVFSYARP